MPDVPLELRDKYIHVPHGYETDNLINGMSDRELLYHMGVPPAYMPWAIDLSKEPMHPAIEQWVGLLPYIFRPQIEKQNEQPNFCGKGLILYGPSGTGKTTAAAALLLRVIRMLIPNADPNMRARYYGACMGMYVGWQGVSHMFRESISDEETDEELSFALKCMQGYGGSLENTGDFLVVDDISRERTTDFNRNKLAWLLRERWEYGRPTILTCNSYPEDWAKNYGPVMGAFMDRAFMGAQFTETYGTADEAFEEFFGKK